MTTIRCKMTVQSVTDYGTDNKSVKFVTQYDDTIPEDQRFFKWTPSGEFTMLVNNPVALAQFLPGRVFYCDFTALPPASAS